MNLRCIQCGVGYKADNWSQKHSHFCTGCREARRRNRRRERYTELKDGVVTASPELEEYANLDDHLEDFLSGEDRKPSVAPDRQPVGWLSGYGSEDGRSTYVRDLREELDLLSIRAALDPWWGQNPHWCAPLHVDMPERMVGSACRELQGARNGYKRHLNAGESACDPCMKAQAEYFREYRKSRNPR